MNALDTLDVLETADYLKCSESKVRMLLKSGELEGAQIGRGYVFLRGELVNFIKNRTVNKCQSSSAKIRPIINTSSSTEVSLSEVRAKRRAEKKQSRSRLG